MLGAVSFNPSWLIAIGSIGALLVLMAGHRAVRKILPGMSARSIAETARDTIAVLETSIEQLKRELEAQKLAMARLQSENDTLRELVTSAARVEALAQAEADRHLSVMAALVQLGASPIAPASARVDR